MNSDVVEKRLFDAVSEYVLNHMPIGGRVYYRGLRPIAKAGDFEEDAVVAFLTGVNGDVQSGTCLVNVYVPDTQAQSGTYYTNKLRCAEIAELLEDFPDFANHLDKDLYFKQSDMIFTMAEEEIAQHFVSLKMEFKVLNEHY